jgi:hypothetical protein
VRAIVDRMTRKLLVDGGSSPYWISENGGIKEQRRPKVIEKVSEGAHTVGIVSLTRPQQHSPLLLFVPLEYIGMDRVIGY